MKKTQFIPIIVYFFVVFYFAIFNWKVFSIFLKISLGFSAINLPVVAMIFLIGLVFIFIQLGLNHLSNLKLHQLLIKKENEINSLQKECELKFVKKDNEINALKASFYDEWADQIKKNSESIFVLQTQLNNIMERLPAKVIDDLKEKTPTVDESNLKKKSEESSVL